jgi:hypothetical protein
MSVNDSKRRINEDVKELLTRASNKESAFEGTVLEGRERRYTIINEKDLNKYVNEDERDDLNRELSYVQRKIEEAREEEGKKPYNSYIIINTDEPYILEIIEVMKRHGHFE